MQSPSIEDPAECSAASEIQAKIVFEIDFVPTDGTRLLIVEAATSVGCRFSEQLSGKQCA